MRKAQHERNRWTFVSQRKYLPLRTGVAAATASIGPTFARGLLTRSPGDQAIVSGAAAAYWLGFASLGLSTVQAVADLIARPTSARHTDGPDTSDTEITEDAVLAATAIVGLVGAAIVAATPDTHDVPMPLAVTQSVAWVLTGGTVASAAVIGADKALDRWVGRRSLPVDLAVSVGIGAVGAAVDVVLRDLRATRFGEGSAAERRVITGGTSVTVVAKSAATAVATTGTLVGLAALQFAIAEALPALASKILGRDSRAVTPLLGHAAAAGVLTAAAVAGVNYVNRRLLHSDDVVESAYPEPPTNPHVTAGPTSVVSFDSIGKHGRRFVLMTLTPDEITDIMSEPAVAPVRAVAGFQTAATPQERAKIALVELDRLGAFDRSLIVVAAPTGVGYVNYSFAEAVEYLTRGDCAIIVPQYALVPSALALRQTNDGVLQQTLILEGIRDRVAAMPHDQRPRVVQFGESLGAQVAMDVAASPDADTARYAELGLSGGLYLGTPFRSRMWSQWFADPGSVDPDALLGQVPTADAIATLPPTTRHTQVIHDDDPITKFDYAMVVRAPWWMGPPASRPPAVPRETIFRPVITFIIAVIDLKNGMNSRLGQFVRLGHDYRIELREAVQLAYDLPATEEQAERIETALRDREVDWAARRMIAARFAHARDSVMSQFSKWGEDAGRLGLDDLTASALARGDVGRRKVTDIVRDLTDSSPAAP